MKLDRDDLQRSFQRFEMIEPAFDRLIARREHKRRIERIQAGVIALAVVAIAAALLGRSMLTTQPAGPAPSSGTTWSSADVDGVTFTNPGGWHLTGYFNATATEITLTNFAPDLSSTQPCDAMPADGAMLAIDPQARDWGGTWPAELTPGPIADTSAMRCDGDHLDARWTVGQHGFEAVATLGPDVSATDTDALRSAFAALTFPRPADATSTESRCFDTVGEVLGAETTGVPWTAYAVASSACEPGGGILLAGADEGFGYAAPITPTAGQRFEVTDVKYGLHSYVTALVDTGVARVMLSGTEGPAEATLVPGGPLFPDVQLAVATFDGFPWGSITGYDAAGAELASTGFRPGMDCFDYVDSCNARVQPGGTIAASADPRFDYRLVERDGRIDLLDGNGATLSSAPITPGQVTYQETHVGNATQVLFGAAPDNTTLMTERVQGVGWALLQSTHLADGTVVFWRQADIGQTLGIAAFDWRCQEIETLSQQGPSGSPATTADCFQANG
jgi:hypothetical protein